MSDSPNPSQPKFPGKKFDHLVEIMQTLRSPTGCPWDKEQTIASLRTFILEETYELLDAIDQANPKAMCDELGDFIFEAVFLAQVCAENSYFDISDALESVTEKLIRRHPHVFVNQDTDNAQVKTVKDVKLRWEEIKAAELRETKRQPKLMGNIPLALPELLRAVRIGKRAANVGFDWKNVNEVLDKVEEELTELREAIKRKAEKDREEELGDLLFALVNLSRHLEIDPEIALKRANRKFLERFSRLEKIFSERGIALRDTSLELMNSEWNQLKKDF